MEFKNISVLWTTRRGRAAPPVERKFGGTVSAVFQPAEEDEPSGGRRVVEEGLLDDIAAAICVHVDPYTQSGKVAVRPGPYTLACDTFDVRVTGSAAHAAKPYEGVDAIAVAYSMVTELEKIVSLEIVALTLISAATMFLTAQRGSAGG